MESFSKLLAWVKIRWDQGGMILTFATYCLMIIATSDKFIGLLATLGFKGSVYIATLIFIIIGIILGFSFVVGFGHFLIKIRYMENYAEEANSRNPTLLEILKRVKNIEKGVK